jgi:hypothetical protein
METLFSTPQNTQHNVNINAFYFKNRAAQLASFPKQMELDGQQYYFLDDGLRYLIRHGQRLVQLFDVSDGRRSFRLRNSGDDWQLVSMKYIAG